MLRFEPPAERHRTTYLEALSEFRAEGDLHALHAELFHASTDFAAFVARLLEKADPQKVPTDRVPESVLWLFDDSTLLGRTSIRHLLQMSSGVRFSEVYSGTDDVSTLVASTFMQRGGGGVAASRRTAPRHSNSSAP